MIMIFCYFISVLLCVAARMAIRVANMNATIEYANSLQLNTGVTVCIVTISPSDLLLSERQRIRNARNERLRALVAPLHDDSLRAMLY